MAEHEEKHEGKDDGAVHKVDTVPPPPGEDDAYSAPTRIGPMADVAVQELMRQAEQHAAEEDTVVPSTPKPSVKPTPPPPPPRAEVLSSSDLIDEPLPRVYADEDEDADEDAATMLHPSAKPPPVSGPVSNVDILAPPPAEGLNRWRIVSFVLAISLFVFAVIVALSR